MDDTDFTDFCVRACLNFFSMKFKQALNLFSHLMDDFKHNIFV